MSFNKQCVSSIRQNCGGYWRRREREESQQPLCERRRRRVKH
jgi:hypothetical protein